MPVTVAFGSAIRLLLYVVAGVLCWMALGRVGSGCASKRTAMLHWIALDTCSVRLLSCCSAPTITWVGMLRSSVLLYALGWTRKLTTSATFETNKCCVLHKLRVSAKYSGRRWRRKCWKCQADQGGEGFHFFIQHQNIGHIRCALLFTSTSYV